MKGEGKNGAATRPEEMGLYQFGYPCRAKQFAVHALRAFKGMFRPPRRPTFVSRRTKVGKKRLLSTAPAVRVSYLIKAGLPCVRRKTGSLDQRETVEGWLGRGSSSRPEQCSLLRPDFGSQGLGTSRSDRSRGDAVFAENVAIARREVATGSCPRESGAQCKGVFFVYFFAPTKK